MLWWPVIFTRGKGGGGYCGHFSRKWYGAVDTFPENGTVLSYKLTEGNHIGDGNIWEFCLTDAHFNEFHSAS